MDIVTGHTRRSSDWTLRKADTGIRLFLTAFLIVLTCGYAAGLIFVKHTTRGSSDGLVEEYRGSPDVVAADEIKYEKSLSEMMTLLHNHLLSLALVFLLLGSIFYFNSIITGPVRTLLMVEPFVAILTTFGGIFLMRFVSAHFSWLVILSGASMMFCFVSMVIISLVDLWRTS
jgi:hypothetical protein